MTHITTHNTHRGNQTAFEKVFCVGWLSVIAYMIVLPVTNNRTLIRLIWIPTMLFIFAFSFPRDLSRRQLFEIATPIAILAFSLIGQAGAGDIEHLLSAFCYINLLLVINICAEHSLTKYTFDYIYYSSVALGLLFSVYSFTPIAHRVHTGPVVWQNAYFVFDLENSNYAAMVLFSFYCVLLINLSYRKRKLLILPLISYIFYMIVKTNCRSAILSAVVVAIAYVLWGKRKIPHFIIILSCLAPAAFIFVYLALFQKLGGDSRLILNKTLFSGRQYVYYDYLLNVQGWKDILFGNFALSGLNNAHNSILSIYTSLGIIGVFCFYSFYFRILSSIEKRSNSSIQSVCLVCILGFFIQSSMEASYFLGGFPGIMFLSTFVLLSNYRDYSENQLGWLNMNIGEVKVETL